MAHEHTMIHTSIEEPAQCFDCGKREKASEHQHKLIQSDGGHSGIPYLYCTVKGCEYEEYTKREEESK